VLAVHPMDVQLPQDPESTCTIVPPPLPTPVERRLTPTLLNDITGLAVLAMNEYQASAEPVLPAPHEGMPVVASADLSVPNVLEQAAPEFNVTAVKQSLFKGAGSVMHKSKAALANVTGAAPAAEKTRMR
jgi:hypothetical protein